MPYNISALFSCLPIILTAPNSPDNVPNSITESEVLFVSVPECSMLHDISFESLPTYYNTVEGTSMITQKLNLLDSFKKLKDNWDGYDAAPIKRKSIQHACEIVKNVMYQPSIFPSPNGNIQFEYGEKNDILYLYIEDDNINMTNIANGEIKSTSDFVFDLSTIKEGVNNYYAGRGRL